MDTVKDIIENIKDRLTSPLFFSFIVSWLFFNWEISVGLLWWDTVQIERAGYENIYDFINNNKDIWFSFVIPLGCALFYTFIYPYINKKIKVFHAGISHDTEKETLRVSEDQIVPMDMYLAQKKDISEKRKQLQEVLEQDSVNLLAATAAKAEELKLRDILSSKDLELNQLRENIKSLILDRTEQVNRLKLQLDNIKNRQVLEGIYDFRYNGVGLLLEIDTFTIYLRGTTLPENIFDRKAIRDDALLHIEHYMYNPVDKMILLVVTVDQKGASRFSDLRQYFNNDRHHYLFLTQIQSEPIPGKIHLRNWSGEMDGSKVSLEERLS